MTNAVDVTFLSGSALAGSTDDRPGSPLLTAGHGPRVPLLSRPAARGRRGFPDPVSVTPAAPHTAPVPFSAHETPRAIRVRRSPR